MCDSPWHCGSRRQAEPVQVLGRPAPGMSALSDAAPNLGDNARACAAGSVVLATRRATGSSECRPASVSLRLLRPEHAGAKWGHQLRFDPLRFGGSRAQDRRRPAASDGNGRCAALRNGAGGGCRLQDRAQPMQDRLPLREIGLDIRRGQVEQGEPLLDAAYVSVRFAQRRDERKALFRRPRLDDLGSFGAGVQPHADRSQLAAARCSTRGRVRNSARHSAADSRSKIELHTGIRMASAYMTTRAQVESRETAGGVQHDVVDAGRRTDK